jgi:hypothetical protein
LLQPLENEAYLRGGAIKLFGNLLNATYLDIENETILHVFRFFVEDPSIMGLGIACQR